MPQEMKDYIKTRLAEILSGNGGEKFEHISREDRESIKSVIQSTNSELLIADDLQKKRAP
jgi:hypothetical protein